MGDWNRLSAWEKIGRVKKNVKVKVVRMGV